MTTTRVGNTTLLTSSYPSASVSFSEGNQDGNSAKGTVTRTVQGSKYKIYPWGTNNKLVDEMLALYRSNGDVMNLVQTRADFLYGDGCGWFRHRNEGKTLIREPYTDNKIKTFGELNDTQELTNTQLTYMCETGNAFMNHSLDPKNKGKLVLSLRDSVTVRAVVATQGFVDTWLLAPDWSNPKGTVALPSLRLDTKEAPDTIFQIKKMQSGQFYYGFPLWWATAEWIKLANRIPLFHNNGLDTEYNVNRICRVAEEYIKKFGGDTEEGQEAFRQKFYRQVDELLFSQDGKRKVIFDECAIGTDNKMIPFIQFEEIKTSLTGKEYNELYDMAIRAFANASGILAGLVGVSDGKMLGGSGSELRVSAEYQQFYRTPRERQAIESYWNRQIKPYLGLPDDVYFGFNNILLETLDKEKSGSSQKQTGSGNAPATKTEQSTDKKTK